jgi:aquaporin Z
VSLLKPFIAEFVGTFALVFVGLAALLASIPPVGPLPGGNGGTWTVALAQGLAIAFATACFAGVSGAHLNPAVTVGELAAKRISYLEAAAYVVAQLAAATFAAALCRLVYPYDALEQCALGTPLPSRWVEGTTSPLGTLGTLLLVETVLTFLFVLAWLHGTERRGGSRRRDSALVVGATWAFCVLAAAPISGAGLNPARAFGPAFVWGDWSWHWVYWIAPLLGALGATALWRYYLEERDDELRK